MPASGGPEYKPLEVFILDPLDIDPDPGEVLRYMGYPVHATPDLKIASRVRSTIDLSRRLIRPKGIYAIYRVISTARRRLVLDGGGAFAGPIGDYLGKIKRVAVFLATAGSAIVAQADEAVRAGDALGGFVLNAIGSHVADAAVGRIAEKLRMALDCTETITLPFSPGYCGISLSQQRTVFRLLDASAVGVQLLPTLVMKPVKSVSGLIGIGRADTIAALGNPCDRCSLINCEMRR